MTGLEKRNLQCGLSRTLGCAQAEPAKCCVPRVPPTRLPGDAEPQAPLPQAPRREGASSGLTVSGEPWSTGSRTDPAPNPAPPPAPTPQQPAGPASARSSAGLQHGPSELPLRSPLPVTGPTPRRCRRPLRRARPRSAAGSAPRLPPWGCRALARRRGAHPCHRARRRRGPTRRCVPAGSRGAERRYGRGCGAGRERGRGARTESRSPGSGVRGAGSPPPAEPLLGVVLGSQGTRTHREGQDVSGSCPSAGAGPWERFFPRKAGPG